MACTNNKAIQRVVDKILKDCSWIKTGYITIQRNAIYLKQELIFIGEVKLKTIEGTYPGRSKADDPLPVHWGRPQNVEDMNH